MDFGLVASDGKKMDPVFIPTGIRMGATEYLNDVLIKYVLPWVKDNFKDNENAVLKQDGAPCHTANIVQNWLKSNLNIKAWSDMDEGYIRSICSKFRPRIEAVV